MMFAVVMLLAATPVDVPAAVKARLSDTGVVRGGFEQRKQVKGFKKPLVSKGEFIVARGHGVKWHTRTPFESLLTVRKDDITSKQGEQVVFQLDASKEPTVRIINSVLFAMLAGDIDVLRSQFDVTGTAEGTTWALELTPKNKGLARVLSRITLRGDAFVRHLELSEASQDLTVIDVIEPASGPVLSAAEEAGW